MRNKKYFGILAILLFILVVVLWLNNQNSFLSSAVIQHKGGVVVSHWNTGLGAVDKDTANLDNQKLSYSVTLWNDSTKLSYITHLKLKLPDTLQTHIKSGATVISVNRELSPNETYQVKGELILDTKGMTKEEILTLGNIQGIIVETSN